MKILLLGFTKMKFMPYASFYLDQIDYSKNEVSIVYWNRDMKEEDLSKYDKSIRFFEFQDEMEDTIPKLEKVRHFLRYRNFVGKILRGGHFDRIISLHTLPGLLNLDRLSISYKRKYILDYRDMTFETNPLFRKAVAILSKNSIVTFVSSDDFRQYLPSDCSKIITSHNILEDSLSHRDDRITGYIPSEKIRIAFWGLIRHASHNILIIDNIANDPRFELHYYGREQASGRILKEHCEREKIKNVFFHGEYKPQDRYSFALKTDIIHNNYLDINMLSAMGNKYYDGIIFRIPQLCMPGSYMGKRCIERGVGFVADPREKDFADKVYREYSSLNKNDFTGNCDNELQGILEEYNFGKEKVREILNS